MRKISIDEISQKSKRPSEIIDDIRKSHYSLLSSLGCEEHKFLNFGVRLACRFFLGLSAFFALFLRKKYGHEAALKCALGKIFARGAPFAAGDMNLWPVFDESEEGIYIDCGLVIGFNHPSLGEIIRLMAVCMLGFTPKSYLFPVNIVWFEALAPITNRLSKYGFTLMPVITPSAKATLLEHCTNDEQRNLVERLATGFSQAYAAKATEFIRDKQVVLVAPSARRRYHIFPSKEAKEGDKMITPQTMTLLVASLMRRRLDYVILPVAVIPPLTKSRGLNILRKYQFFPCEIFKPSDAEELCKTPEPKCEGRRLERSFLERIALKLKSVGLEDMIVGPD